MQFSSALQIARQISAKTLSLFTVLCVFAVSAWSQTWTQLSPTPDPINGSPTVAYNSEAYNPATNRLILFGGATDTQGYAIENNIWVLTNADGTGGTPAWTKLAPLTPNGAPGAREFFSAGYDQTNNLLIVQGGYDTPGYCSGSLSDTWILTNADGSSGTPTWIPLTTTGTAPLRRSSMVTFDAADDVLIVSGGLNGGCGSQSDETWVLTNANGLGTGPSAWTELFPTNAWPWDWNSNTPCLNSPCETVNDPNYEIFGAGYNPTSNMLVDFAVANPGQTPPDAFTWSSRVRALSYANDIGGSPAWADEWVRWTTDTTSPGPLAFANPAVAYDAPLDDMAVFGGQIFSGSDQNAVWILQNASGQSGTPAWTELTTAGTPPSVRTANNLESLQYNPQSNSIILYGGGNGSTIYYDVWVLNNVFPIPTTTTLTSLNPSSGSVGVTVIITGTNFGSTQGSSTIEFNGTTATVTSWSSTSIVVNVPNGATSGNVVVTVAGVASNGLAFTVEANPSPTLTSLNPTSGTIETAITITGANFGAAQGSSTVEFNGTLATVTSWSSTSIVVPVPIGATSGDVVVTVAAVASNGVAFTVLPITLPTHAAVITAIEEVNNYWMATNPPANNDWDGSTYYTGDLAAYDATGDASYLTYAQAWANSYDYGLLGGNSTNNANSQAAGQAYIRLDELNPVASDLTGITLSLNDMVAADSYGVWSWVDALNMSMPVFAELGTLDNDPTYYNTMYLLYENTKVTQQLYDPLTGLWWRDSSYINSGIHWSRGNGWAFAALTKTLNVLPNTDPHYTEYLNDYLGMAHELATLQQPGGYWNTDLTGSEYAGPESSGTGFFLYGFAWGINNGILDSSYLPVVENAWNYFVTTAMQPTNPCCLLGYEQPADVGPDPSTATGTANFGVGSFLLAGQQMEILIGKASATLTLTSTNGSGTVGVTPVVTSDYTLTGFQGTDTQASACTGTPAITTTATSASPVSPPTYPITAANGTLVCSSTDYTYTITDVSTGVYTINGAGTSPLTLTTTNNPSNPITYGSSVPSVATDYTLTGFIGGDTQASACTGTPTLSTTATSSSAPGSYPITAVVGTLVCTSIHATYTVTIVNNGNVVIGKASATLTLTSTSASGSTGVTPVVLSDYSLTGFQGTDTQATACTGAPSVTTSATSSSPAGPYPITAAVGTLACSSTDYIYIVMLGSNSGQLTLTGSTGTMPQTITFPVIPYQSYGAVGTVFNPGATASSGLAITYTVVYGPATVSGNGVMITGSGDITVTASQAGNTTYSAATPITRTFSVLQSGVSWPSPTSITYGTPASVFMTVQSTITTGTTVYSNGAQVLTPTTVLAAGKYSISAVFTSTPGWVLKIPLTLVVAPAPLTVTVNSLSVTYNSQVPASYSYSIAGFVNGDPSSVVTGVPTITTTATAKATKTSGVSLYTSPVGSYALNATTGSLKATNYTFTFVSGTLTITPATTPLTITATNVNIMYASQLPATYRYTVTGLLGFDSAASAGTGTPSITSTATTTSPAGTYPITAAAGTFLAPNYSGVIYVNGTANIVR